MAGREVAQIPWLTALCVVNFDLEFGQSMCLASYPPANSQVIFQSLMKFILQTIA